MAIAEIPWGKRQKCVGKTTPIDASQQWQEIFSKLNQEFPRVGKVHVHEDSPREAVQRLMPEKNIISIVACRGASRTLASPEQMSKGVAPFRCCIFTERGTGELRAEAEWEPWENLAKRNLIRPSHATRINMTVFAKNDVPRRHRGIPKCLRLLERAKTHL